MSSQKNNIFLLSVILLTVIPSAAKSQTEAILGESSGNSVGVGCVVVPFSPQDMPQPLGLAGVQIYEENNRVLYPVVEVREVPDAVTNTFKNAKRPIGRLVGSILEQTGSSVAIYFLFAGKEEPLQLTIAGNRAIQKTVTPTRQPVRYRQLLNDWWTRYNKETSPFLQANDYPPVVKEYLRTMLSFRLGLQRPEQKPPIWHKLFYSELGFQLDPTIALFEAQTNLFLKPEQYLLKADQPLPPSLAELIRQQQGVSLKIEPATVYQPVSYQNDEQKRQEQAGSDKLPSDKLPSDKLPSDKAKAVWDSLTQGFAYMTGQTSGNESQTVKPGNDGQSQYETGGAEPIAFHVPAHCFYIRFGSYSNFAWFQETTTLWGGDLRNMIALRALNNRAGERLERQIGLRQDALAKLFGDSVIDDVAVIGTDLFFDDGASFGLLFRAKNSNLLSSDFQSKRQAILKKHPDATERILDVQGQKVSCISTPDQRIRTWYAAMGDYHLVARSERLIRDFIALHSYNLHNNMENSKKQNVPEDKPLSLGELPEFQQVRGIMPNSRKETIFLYFSRPYFYNIASPAYWIETQRRETAAAGIELVRLGSMAAAAEGHAGGNDTNNDPNRWLHLLKTGGFIPPAFGAQPDGSRTILESWSDIRDSLRGYRGSFVPIADLLPIRVTTAEYIAYQKMCRQFFDQWGNLDPVVVSIMRRPVDSPERKSEGKTEHIVIDARMAPLSKKNSESLRRKIGQPMLQKMTPVQGNIASFELALADQFFFGALQNDMPPRKPGEQVRPLERIVSGIVLQDSQMMLSELLAGYLGYLGRPGPLLNMWNMVFPPRDDASGYSKSIDGTWRRHFGEYTLYSRQLAILDAIAPQLGFMPAEYAAQLRLQAGNPVSTRIAPVLNSFGYARTRDTIRGNVRLLNDLQMQFHVSGPHCKDVAEQILGAELVCPLGGAYQFQPFGGATVPDAGRWISTALASTYSDGTANQGALSMRLPDGFLAPPLNWFRGGKIDGLVSPDAVSIHAELDMLLPKENK
ncbi:MAG: hypothetical protein FWC50_06560 [Planctomycetaceae bacterium]|nr:hypothetical protein [Planctomycetaceae bacterium]